MRFSQKAYLCNRAHFDFGARELHVVIDDGRLKVGFSTAYHEIGTKKSIKSFPEKAVMHSGVAVLMAAAAAYGVTGSAVEPAGLMIFSAFILAGIFLCILGGSMKFDATRLPVVSGNAIVIFHDHQHGVILNEIQKRRASELLRLNGEIDRLNLPQLELKKFRWLKEEGVITEQEFEETSQRIAGMLKTPSRFK